VSTLAAPFPLPERPRVWRLRDALLTGFFATLACSISGSQALLAALFLLVLPWTSAARSFGSRGWLTGVAREIWTDAEPLRRHPLTPPLLAYTALSILSAVFSGDPGGSLWLARDTLRITTFYLVLWYTRDAVHALRLWTGFLAVLTVMATYGLVQAYLCGGQPGGLPGGWVINVCPHPSRVSGPFSIYMTFGGVLLLGALFMVSYLANVSWRRVWWMVPAGAITVAALAFTFGGPMAARIQHAEKIFILPWFPLAFLLLKQALDRGSLIRTLLAAIVASLIALSGNQLSVLMFYSFALFFLFRVAADDRRLDFVKTRGPLFLVFVAAALALAAIQLLPALQFSDESNRSSITYDNAVANSMWPGTLLTLFFPNFFGAADVQGYWGHGDPTEAYLYLGAAPILMAGVGVLVLPRAKSRDHWFFLLLAVAALVYSLGRYTPAYSLFYHFVPGVSVFRRPPDATWVLSFAVAFLAGIGLHELLSNPRRWTAVLFFVGAAAIWALVGVLSLNLAFRWSFPLDLAPAHRPDASQAVRWFLLFGGVTLAIATLALSRWHRAAPLAGVLLIALTAADLLALNSGIDLSSQDAQWWQVSSNSIYGDRNIIPFLKEGLSPGGGQLYRVEPVYAGTMWHNGPLIWKTPSTVGYTALLTWYARFDEYASVYNDPSQPRTFTGLVKSYNSPLFDLLNVRYIVSPRELREIDPAASDEKFALVYDSGYKIYENTGVLPRAFIVPAAKVVHGDGQVRSELLSDAFDPTDTVVIDEAPAELEGLPAADDVLRFPRGRTSVTIVGYSPNEITVGTRSDEDGFLVLSEVFYPGWKVYVDGKEKELLRADYLFRALHLEAGDHTVRFVFRPSSFRAGAAITFATLALILGALATTWGLKWRRHG